MKVKLCPRGHVNDIDRRVCVGFGCTHIFNDRPEPFPDVTTIKRTYPSGTVQDHIITRHESK